MMSCIRRRAAHIVFTIGRVRRHAWLDVVDEEIRGGQLTTAGKR